MKTYTVSATEAINGLFHTTDNDGWRREFTKAELKGFTKTGKSAEILYYYNNMRMCIKTLRIQFVDGVGGYVNVDRHTKFWVLEEA